MLRPKISTALRATIMPPLGFQSAPVMQAFAASNAAQDLHTQQQTARIEALQASLRHQVAKNDRQCELMAQAAETIASLRTRLTAQMPDYIDVVRTVFIDGDEFLCGFVVDGKSLHLEKMFAIGAVDVSSYEPGCMARMAEREAERQIDQERDEAAYEKGADQHEFKRAFGG